MVKQWKVGKRNISCHTLLLAGILLIGCLVRLIALDKSPMGLHQDEAYSAYNAWSVMNYGVDSYGYTRPVYYTVWGSGMSVLYSYLTMPFLAVLGITAWAIRLPQAILGCVSILAVYGLGKELWDEKAGTLCAALLAVNPWHIRQSRFGLDASLAVPMLLFAMYFLCRYLNGKRGSLWGTVIFLGLTLYCYVLTWLLLPLFLVLAAIFFRKRIAWNRQLVAALALLFIMAVPLLLFLAVNFGLIKEIRTGWFSVPRLPALRTGEMALSLSALKKRFLWLVAMLWSQHDDMWWMTDSTVGSYYYISTPFILLGMVYHVKTLWNCVRRKEGLPLHFILALWFGAAFLIGCNIDLAKFHKVNFIHVPVILYGVIGVMWVCRLLKKWKWVPAVVGGAYTLMFGYYLFLQLSFGTPYELYGNSHQSHMHWYRYEEAIDRAEELTDGDIYIWNLNYANVMLYKKITPQEYLEQVVYTGENLAFREVKSIGRYHFSIMPEESVKAEVIVYPYNMEQTMIDAGYVTERVTECYGVAYERSAR